MGNHEEYFVDFLFGSDDIMWLQDDNGLCAFNSLVAGHVNANIIVDERQLNEIYFDGFNHYYVDACSYSTPIHIALSKFNSKTKKYVCFKKAHQQSGKDSWAEYPIALNHHHHHNYLECR
jgi:hypothetical protein